MDSAVGSGGPRCGSSGCRGSWGVTGACGTLGTEKPGLQARAGTSGPRGAGSSAVGSAHRHVG